MDLHGRRSADRGAARAGDLTDRRTRRTRTVGVAAYRLGRVPVTQAEYAQVTGERPSAARGDRLPVESVSSWDGTGGPRYGPLDEIAWYRGNSGERISGRASVRRRSHPGLRIEDVGFRLARSPAPAGR